MPSAVHISGIRVAHVEGPTRAVRVNRPRVDEGPITWDPVQKVAGLSIRQGGGSSGLSYRVRQQQREWRVTVVVGIGREVEIGRARMHDHAQALARMWEEAVVSGRIDMS